LAKLPLWQSRLVTVTVTAPAAWTGVVAAMPVLFTVPMVAAINARPGAPEPLAIQM